jgi:hypothetical protein
MSCMCAKVPLHRGLSAGRRTTTFLLYEGERRMDSIDNIEHVAGRERGDEANRWDEKVTEMWPCRPKCATHL